MSERVVIIGGSHGAHSVIETLKRERFRGKLTLISEEKIPLYSPTALPYLLWDKKKERRFLRPGEFYRDLEVIEGKALFIHPEKGKVLLENGKKVSYDRLVIATGASAAGLPLEVPKKSAVLTLRRIGDLVEIEKRARRGQSILIVGAGLIGLHLAQIFSKEKKQVQVIELRDQILPGLVHPDLASTLKDRFEEKGIRISLGTAVAEFREKEARLSNGEKVKMDLAIAAVGIRTNLASIRETSISAAEGILVDGKMETSVPGVYACGDVAEYRDFFTGENRLNPNLVSAGEQGRCAAEYLMGKGSPHPGLISINTFNCFGLSLVSLGRFVPEEGDLLFEENDPEKRVYRRMVFREGKLRGAVFFNTQVDGGIFYRLIRERISLKGLEEKLLRDPLLWGKWIAEKTFTE
jgi:NAD(P)H-nitrite reductase large subunit